MAAENYNGRAIRVAPLALRLALAAIFFQSGLRNFGWQGLMPAASESADALATTDVLPADEVVAISIDKAVDATEKAALAETAKAATDAILADDSSATDVAEESGATLRASWDWKPGLLKFGAAGLLLVGLVTRLVGLVILVNVAYAAVMTYWGSGVPGGPDCPLSTFESNQTGFFLLGAIGLTLLVSGPGCLGFDRVLARRRALRREARATRLSSPLRDPKEGS